MHVVACESQESQKITLFLVDRKIARTSRCDLGHEHTIIQSDPLYFQIMHIPWDRAEALATWILGMETDEQS